MKCKAGKVTFESKKTNITHVVLNSLDTIMAKCSSIELAKRQKAKDEYRYGLTSLRIVEAKPAP